MQVELLGSDGNRHAFLAKPNDDLRKDNRMMEVVGILNRLFLKDPAARRRNLYIRRWPGLHLHSVELTDMAQRTQQPAAVLMAFLGLDCACSMGQCKGM